MKELTQINIPILNNFLQKVPHAPLVDEKELTIQNKLVYDFSESIQGNNELIAKFEKISTSLLKMGLSPSLITNSFLAFKYKSIEEALEVLEKDRDDLWIHKFIESDEKKCFVCGHLFEQHRTASLIMMRESSAAEDQQLLRKLSLKKESSGKKGNVLVDIGLISNNDVVLKVSMKNCTICWAELEDSNKILLKCSHEFCKTCIVEFINEEIKNSRVLKIKCPTLECNEIFTEDFLKSLVTDEQFNKYKKFCLSEKLKDNPNFIPCPIVNCEGYADITDNHKSNENIMIQVEISNEEENKNEPLLKFNNETRHKLDESQKTKEKKNIKLICSNLHNFCSSCNQAWHNDSSCLEDKEIKTFATESGFILKKCPKCKVWTEKNEGCNHMGCKLCKYDWCWLCEQECKPDHYFQPNTPCYGKQFNNMDPEDLEMIQLLQDNENFFGSSFVVFILSFFLINQTIRNLRNEPRQGQVEIGVRTALCIITCCLTIFAIILAISNGLILISMLTNLGKLVDLRQDSGKVLCFFSFIILWLTLYLNGLFLSFLWMCCFGFYAFIKVIIVFGS